MFLNGSGEDMNVITIRNNVFTIRIFEQIEKGSVEIGINVLQKIMSTLELVLS